MSNFTDDNNLSTLIRVLRYDPKQALDRCRDQYKIAASAHNETLYETIAFIVAFVLKLDDNPQDRDEFLTSDYWQAKPHRPKEEDLSRLATMYVLGALKSEGALYDQACIYTKVVDYYLEFDFNPIDIPESLKRKRGIYNLLDDIKPKMPSNNDGQHERGGSQAVAKGAGHKSEVVCSDDDSDNLFDDELLGPDTDDNGQGGNEQDLPARRPELQSKAADGGGSGKPARMTPRFNPASDILVRGGAYQSAILALLSGHQKWVCLRRTDDGGPDDWKRFEIVAVASDMPPNDLLN